MIKEKKFDQRYSDIKIVEIPASEEKNIKVSNAENLSDLSKEIILERLKNADFCINPGSTNGREVIVSAVEKDPLCAVFQQLVRENLEYLNEYFDILKLILENDNIFFAVQENIFDLVWELQTSGITIHKVSPFYPNGIPEILVNSMKAQYDMKSPVYISIEDVLNAMSIIRNEKPNSYKVLTLTDKNGTSNLEVKSGTTYKEVLKNSDIKKIKKVIIGGPLRGFTIYDLNLAITNETDSIYVQYEDEVIRSVNNQCINCSRCNDICPALLKVNFICRYSEFSIFEKCKDMFIENCIECGLCSYYCPAGRSLLQLIQLAKNEIKKIEGEVIL